jgi:hypothetical protein
MSAKTAKQIWPNNLNPKQIERISYLFASLQILEILEIIWSEINSESSPILRQEGQKNQNQTNTIFRESAQHYPNTSRRLCRTRVL